MVDACSALTEVSETSVPSPALGPSGVWTKPQPGFGLGAVGVGPELEPALQAQRVQAVSSWGHQTPIWGFIPRGRAEP